MGKKTLLFVLLAILCLTVITASAQDNVWRCMVCGLENTGEICEECGHEKGSWLCPECHELNHGDACAKDSTPRSAVVINEMENGDVYIGGRKDGKRNGWGIYRYAAGKNSLLYDGQWKDGKQEGQGTNYFANGNIYEGEWKAGKRDGRGKLTYADGSVFEGEWIEGQKVEKAAEEQAPETVANTPIPTVTNTSEAAALKVGDTFTFGKYEQDNNKENGTEAIEWQVLAVEKDRALVISKYALDTKKYNEKQVSVTWETCTLRQWLNGDFYNSAFSSEEKARIRQVTILNLENPFYLTKGGNQTTDRIFLLSIYEVNKYFRDDEARKCKATDYAKTKGAWGSGDYGTTWWMLRSPGLDSELAASVSSYGTIKPLGNFVDDSQGVVRPAFWLNL